MKHNFFSFYKRLQYHRTLFLFSLPLFVSLIVAIVISQHVIVQSAQIVLAKKEVSTAHISPTEKVSPTVTASEQKPTDRVAIPTTSVQQITPTATQHATNTNASSNPTATLVPTTQMQQITPTPIPAATVTSTSQPTLTPTITNQTVSVQIQTPDGNSNFSINLTDNMNVCDVLTKAKSEGKINSLTLSDAYMNTLHSMYVAEMNGFSNNWIFTVNGSSPLGCSLINPKPNDTIVWKFG